MRTDLELIAEANGLELIDTSSARNGYPQQLQQAIIGFDTFEDAEMLAEEHGLSIAIFSKLDGWGIWYRTNRHPTIFAHWPIQLWPSPCCQILYPKANLC